MRIRVSTVLIPAIAVASSLFASAAAAAPVSGSLDGIKVPRGGNGIASVRAVDLQSARVVDSQDLSRNRFKLQVPPRRTTALISSVMALREGAKPISRLAAVLKVGKKGRRSLDLPARKGKPIRPRARRSARPGFVDVSYPAIWVKHFDVTGPDEYSVLSKGLADMVITDVASTGRCSDGTEVAVVEREKLQDVLREIELQYSDRGDPSARVKRGKIIEHNMEITGSVVTDGTSITLTGVVKDLRGKRSGTATVSGRAADFFSLETELAKKLHTIICSPRPEKYTGTVDATLVHGDGAGDSYIDSVTETFDVDIAFERFESDRGVRYVASGGTLKWTISGRYDNGCTVQGSHTWQVNGAEPGSPTATIAPYERDGILAPGERYIAASSAMPGQPQNTVTNTCPDRDGGTTTEVRENFGYASCCWLGVSGEATVNKDGSLTGRLTGERAGHQRDIQWSLRPVSGG